MVTVTLGFLAPGPGETSTRPLVLVAGVVALHQVSVLGVRPGGRSGHFVSGPPSDVTLRAGDDLVVLTSRDVLKEVVADLNSRNPAPGG